MEFYMLYFVQSPFVKYKVLFYVNRKINDLRRLQFNKEAFIKRFVTSNTISLLCIGQFWSKLQLADNSN